MMNEYFIRKLISLTTCTCVFIFQLFSPAYQKKYSQRVLLISLDGFRWDYLEQSSWKLPNFRTIKRRGASVTRIKPVFPTKTLPAHWSIATGKFVENHGLVSGKFYDPKLRKVLSSRWQKDKDIRMYLDANKDNEPVWITAERQGRSAATIAWIGGGIRMRGVKPGKHKTFASNEPFHKHIEYIVKEFKGGVNIMAVYSEEPDYTGHRHPFRNGTSQHIQKEVEKLDKNIGDLLQRLHEERQTDINVIITSDHGMTNIDSRNIINLRNEMQQYLARETSELDHGAIGQVWPKKNQLNATFNKLVELSRDKYRKQFEVYKKEDLPDRFHYKNNARIAPIILLAKLHTHIQLGDSRTFDGNHGYDNEEPDMQPIFLAYGPNIKMNYRVDAVNSVRSVDIMS